MLKEKLIAAEKALKSVYESVTVQPGVGDAIDIALQPAGLLGKSGNFQAVEILAANGLQPFGYVHSKDFKTLFLRNIQEIQPAVNPPAEPADQP